MLILKIISEPSAFTEFANGPSSAALQAWYHFDFIVKRSSKAQSAGLYATQCRLQRMKDGTIVTVFMEPMVNGIHSFAYLKYHKLVTQLACSANLKVTCSVLGVDLPNDRQGYTFQATASIISSVIPSGGHVQHECY